MIERAITIAIVLSLASCMTPAPGGAPPIEVTKADDPDAFVDRTWVLRAIPLAGRSVEDALVEEAPFSHVVYSLEDLGNTTSVARADGEGEVGASRGALLQGMVVPLLTTATGLSTQEILVVLIGTTATAWVLAKIGQAQVGVSIPEPGLLQSLRDAPTESLTEGGPELFEAVMSQVDDMSNDEQGDQIRADLIAQVGDGSECAGYFASIPATALANAALPYRQFAGTVYACAESGRLFVFPTMIPRAAGATGVLFQAYDCHGGFKVHDGMETVAVATPGACEHHMIAPISPATRTLVLTADRALGAIVPIHLVVAGPPM